MDVQISCLCPPKADGSARHEQDSVTLPETLDFRTTLIVRQSLAGSIGPDVSVPEIIATLIEVYLLHTISAWTLVDDKGKPVPVTKAAVRELLLPHYSDAERVGDAADNLYTEKVVLPLLNRASTSSPATPTPVSTSAPNRSGAQSTKARSKRSSITTTPMVVTGPMAASPGGGSSSSLS